MAEQHDAPDPQALLALLDELESLAANPRLAVPLASSVLRRVGPDLDAGVRALVEENARLRGKLREWDDWYEQSERTAPPKERRR